MKIAILGSGVMGLTVSQELATKGHVVDVFHSLPYSESTSSVAGALWYPSKLEPEAEVKNWALTTLKIFTALAQNPATGIRLLPIRRWFHRRMGSPWWAPHVKDFKLLYPADCPTARCGYCFIGPVIDMPVYLGWLKTQSEALGVKFHTLGLKTPELVPIGYDTYINCTGMGARELFNDPELTPVRGLSLRLKTNFNLEAAFLEWDHPAGIIYIVPRTHEIILGGSEELPPLGNIEEMAANIYARAIQREPRLKNSSKYKIEIGYRPTRLQVRVQRDPQWPQWIHNYGHGGNGVTLSWGCAEKVLSLLSAAP